MTCDKFIYLQVLHFLVLLHPIPRRKRTLWSGQGWMLQSWPVLGGNGRHKSSISTSLGKGRCWWWSIAPPHSAHTSLAVLTALLSFFGGKEYHGVLDFIMGKDKFLAFSHGNLHISNLWEKALLSVCLSGLPVGLHWHQSTVWVEISGVCMTQPAKPSGWRWCVREGPKGVLFPCCVGKTYLFRQRLLCIPESVFLPLVSQKNSIHRCPGLQYRVW